MKSKIQFDLTGQNDAVITARIVDSEDVRDKVARSLKEKLGGSMLMTAYYTNYEPGPDFAKEIEIRPVPDHWAGLCGLARVLPDETLDQMVTAFQREMNYRKRTGLSSIPYDCEYRGYPSKKCAEYIDSDNPRTQTIVSNLASSTTQGNLTNTTLT